MELIGYLASIGVGLILGILGGGGSILTIPILVYLFHFDAVIASAYSLFIVGVTSLIGAIPKYREHLVHLKTGMRFGIPSIIAIFSTRKWIVPMIPDRIFQMGDSVVVYKRTFLLGIFAILMILAAASLLLNKKGEQEDDVIHYSPWLIVEGCVIGFLTGLVGAGGGFLIIPALVLVTGLKFKTAVGTSLLIIGVNSLMGFLGDVTNYEIDWTFLLGFTALAVSGILIGTKIARLIPIGQLRKSFAVFVLITGSWILFKELYLNQ